MTPDLLDQFLAVMQKRGVMQADMQIPWVLNEADGTMATLRLAVTLNPPHEALPGDAPTPGGWKGPEHLDADFKPENPLP